MTEIVKVQRSIFPSGDQTNWLIYAEGRKNLEQLPDRMVPAYIKEAMGDRTKAFFNATWSSVVGWAIAPGGPVKDEDW